MRPLLVQAKGDALPVQRVDPVEMLRDGAGLVALELAGEVPGELQILQFLLLGQRFLQVILTKIALAQRRHAPGWRWPGGPY